MNLGEYVEAQAEINRGVAREVLAMLNPFRTVRLGLSGWLGLLAALYRSVSAARLDAAELGRQFYDSQRLEHLGQTQDAWLSEYEPDWFQEAMEPYRERFEAGLATDATVAQAVGTALKEVENGGRRTIIRAVRNDPAQPRWARVSGDDCCAFCAMLISRGPVYESAKTAGVNSTKSALSIWRQYEQSGNDSALDGLMARFHDNCNCRAIPVFDQNNWPGRDQFLTAQKLWSDVTGDFTGRDKLNAFRRAYERGNPDGLVPLPNAA